MHIFERVPVLHIQDFSAIRMKSICWIADGITLTGQVQAASGRLVANLIQEKGDGTLLVDFRGIRSIDHHAFEDVKKAISQAPYPVVFYGVTGIQELQQALQSSEIEESSYTDGEGCWVVVAAKTGTPRSNFVEMVKAARNHEAVYSKGLLRDCFSPFPTPSRLPSTPVFATGILDARSIIGDPKRFVWVATTLADKIEALIEKDRLVNVRLLAVSLKASPIAMAIAQLLPIGVQVEIVDHIGPRNKILEKYDGKSNSTESDYIYVGDFLVGGTELKIAQFYAQQKGGSLEHAVVIGALLNDDAYSVKSIAKLGLIKDSCPEAKYEFIS